MKQLNVTFEDTDFKKLTKLKDKLKLPWQSYLLQLVSNFEKQEAEKSGK